MPPIDYLSAGQTQAGRERGEDAQREDGGWGCKGGGGEGRGRERTRKERLWEKGGGSIREEWREREMRSERRRMGKT